MAVPKRRLSRTKRNMRRSHHAAKPVKLMSCSRCQAPVMPHIACSNCGTYRGRDVINVTRKLDREQKKAKAKQAAS